MSDRNTRRPHARDRRFAKRMGLPEPVAYAKQTLRIPMRDGTELGADLYEPVGTSKGLLLARGPYGRGAMIAAQMAHPYASQGYSVLFVSSRGTYDSAGDFDPMRTEVADGHDLVEWMRAQPWYPGRFATVGGSYLGHTQWAMLSDPPADLISSVIMIGPHDFSRHAWGTGTFNLDFVGWSDQIVVQSKHDGLAAILKLMTQGRRVKPVLEGVPLADVAERHFRDDAPWVHERMRRPELTDEFWRPMQHADALERVQVPVLLVTGWHDLFARQSFEQFARLRERNIDVALIAGPWTHVQVVREGGGEIYPQMFAWLDDVFAGQNPTERIPAVRAHVTGAGEWRDLESWPPSADERMLRLSGDGMLTSEASDDDGTSTFTYDPAAPTPARGGPIIDFRAGGSVDDTDWAARADVLTWTGDVLDRALTIMGTVSATLMHGAEHDDADVLVRLSDVDAKGRSRNVTEGYVRRGNATSGEPLTLDLLPTAHRFAAGHRIRIAVAGGAFPQFARNPGTGENPLTTETLQPNRHSIAHAGSSIRLPVITGGEA